MKAVRLITILGAVGLLAAFAVAGSATGAPQASAANRNIVQTAVAAGSFTTLVKLVKQAGLAGALTGTTKLTVFAPTDAAFAKVPKSTLTALAKNKALLQKVLLYHVVKGKVTAAKVVNLTSAQTLAKQRVKIAVRNGSVFVNTSKVVTPDVMASNGVIHVINKVLIPAG